MRPLLRSSAFAIAAATLLCGAPGGAEPPGARREAGPPAPEGEAPGPIGPEILHIPILERRTERGILRPVPLSVDLPRGVALKARRVLAHYRLWGDPDWTTIELRRKGPRHEGVIPCREISTVTGDLRYYIRVVDEAGHVIASGASLANPYRVTIKHDTTLSAGARRVGKCSDPADCPRGLPGCPSEPIVEVPCGTDRDCAGGMTCSWRGYCERKDRRLSWFTLAAEQDFGVLHTTGACSVPAQENEGTACYREDGVQYAGSPVLTNEPPGFGRGPTRVVLGFDRLLYFDTSVGVRVGWAVAGEGPTPRGGTPFMPLSIAARATHWFGEDPFARSGLRPFAFITAGVSMFDVKATTHIREDPTAAFYQGGNDLEQRVDLWKRAGDGFVGVGGGLELAFSAGSAALLELMVLDAFPIGALLLAPSAGVALGF
ncbi:hypothetical protein WME91_26535 [Sorangium sp. So ce269]